MSSSVTTTIDAEQQCMLVIKLEAEEAALKAQLKHIQLKLRQFKQQQQQQDGGEEEETKQIAKPSSTTTSTSKTKRKSTKSGADHGSIYGLHGGKRPVGMTPFTVRYHHSRDEMESKSDYRAPITRMDLFFSRGDTQRPTYQQMLNVVRDNETLKIPGQTKNFVIVSWLPPKDNTVFGREMEHAPVVMDYDKYYIVDYGTYDIWPYQVVNNAKPSLVVSCIISNELLSYSDDGDICTSKPWILDRSKQGKGGFIDYLLGAFDSTEEDQGLRFRVMPNLSFSTKNNPKSSIVLYGMTRRDRAIYDAAHPGNKWFDDEDDTTGMHIQGLSASFLALRASKKNEQKKTKRKAVEEEEEEQQPKKKKQKKSTPPPAVPQEQKQRTQEEEYDEDNIDEIPRIVDAGCNTIYTKTVSIVAFFIGGDESKDNYPSLLSLSKDVAPEPFAFIGDGATTIKHLNAFATSKFCVGEHDMFSLGIGVRVNDPGSYVLEPESLVVDGGVYHYYFFGWSPSLPIITQIRVTQDIQDWTVVDFNDVYNKSGILDGIISSSFPHNLRYDDSQPIVFLTRGLTVDENTHKAKADVVTPSRIIEMNNKYRSVIGKRPVILVVLPRLLTLEQSPINTDLKGDAVTLHNNYYEAISKKQHEIESYAAATIASMDQTQ